MMNHRVAKTTKMYFLMIADLGQGVFRAVVIGVLLNAFLPGLQMALFSLCLHVAFPLCVSVSYSPFLIRIPVRLN